MLLGMLIYTYYCLFSAFNDLNWMSVQTEISNYIDVAMTSQSRGLSTFSSLLSELNGTIP